MIQVYLHKWGWPDLPHSNSNLSNSKSPSRSVHDILFLQTNSLALLLHLHLPCLLWSSSLPLALHFKLQRFSQNVPIIRSPQHMPVHHLTPFAFAIWTTVSFNNPNISIRSSLLIFSISFASHIALSIIALLVLLKIAISFSRKHHVSFQ